MPRAKTGTLVAPGIDGLWRARVTKTHANGTRTRPLYSLGTTDKALAKRKLAKLVSLLEAGRDPLEIEGTANGAERVKEYAEAWLAKRQAQGVASVSDERGWLTRHVFEAVGKLPVERRSALARSRHPRRRPRAWPPAQLARSHPGRAASALAGCAGGDELTDHNPVAAVRVPKTREVRKERAILTDEEFTRFVACPSVDLELRMLALVARCEGGMRSGDLKRWDWAQIDRVHFAECTVPRAKTGTPPRRLGIPDLLAPFLRAWWERAGTPESGPVFPGRRGKRAGGFRAARGPGFARQLRRDLFRAGVVRAAPVIDETDPQRKRIVPNPIDPLFLP